MKKIFLVTLIILGSHSYLNAQVPGNRAWLSSKLTGDSPDLKEARKYIESNRNDIGKLKYIFQVEDNRLRSGSGSAVNMLKWILAAVIIGKQDYDFGYTMKNERQAKSPREFFDRYLSSYGYELTRARLLFNVHFEFPYREFNSLAERIFKIDPSDMDMVYAFSILYEPQAYFEDVPKAKKNLERLLRIRNKNSYDYGSIAWIHYLFWMKSKSKSDAESTIKNFKLQRSLSKSERQIKIIDSYIRQVERGAKFPVRDGGGVFLLWAFK